MKLITLVLLIGTLSGAAVFGADEEALSDPIKGLRKYQTDREEKLIKTTLPEIVQRWKYNPYSECFLSITMAINKKKEKAVKEMYEDIEKHRDDLMDKYRKIEFPEIKKNYIWDKYNLRKIDVCLKD